MSGETHADVAVVGLGGIGSAAAYWAARMGASVVGCEQFPLGHDRGGSHDRSRLIRLAYHHADYVRLAEQAYDAWEDVEQEAGEQLVLVTGGVDMFAPDAPLGREVYAASLSAAGAEMELLTGAGVSRRWPQLRPPEGVEALMHPRAGLVASERATAAHQRLARSRGAALLDRCAVRSVRPAADGVVLETAEGPVHCRSVILAAGAWLNDLLAPLDATLPLTVTQEQFSYFAVDDPERFQPEVFPVWIWHGTPTFYGFPVFGEPAVKAAEDHGGPVVTAHTRGFDPDPAATERLATVMAGLVPDAGAHIRSKTCLYTMTPDRDFLIAPLPRHANVVVAVADGHGFKFASLLGRLLAEMAMGLPASAQVDRFAAARPSLRRRSVIDRACTSCHRGRRSFCPPTRSRS